MILLKNYLMYYKMPFEYILENKFFLLFNYYLIIMKFILNI